MFAASVYQAGLIASLYCIMMNAVLGETSGSGMSTRTELLDRVLVGARVGGVKRCSLCQLRCVLYVCLCNSRQKSYLHCTIFQIYTHPPSPTSSRKSLSIKILEKNLKVKFGCFCFIWETEYVLCLLFLNYSSFLLKNNNYTREIIHFFVYISTIL